MPHSVVGGNFRDVFDYEDKVYAVDSLEHMTMGNTLCMKYHRMAV